MRTAGVAAICAILLNSCTPVAPDIRVFRENHSLVIDFPWTFWRMLELGDRHLCIRHVQVFDTREVVWREDVLGDASGCVRLPIPIGVPLKGFRHSGPTRLQAGKTYGVVIDDLTAVNFIPFADEEPQNIIDPRNFIRPPCESGWRPECRGPNSD